MVVQKTWLVLALGSVIALSACQRTTYDYSQPVPPPPQPLAPAPTGQVQSGSLPPPGGASAYPGTTTGTAMPGATTDGAVSASAYPPAPGVAETPGGMGSVAAPAGAMAITNSALVGSWKVSEGGVNCDMFLTLTNLGEGLRGGTRGCTGGLSAMKSWGINGDQVVLSDANGYAIARLYKTGDTRIEGTSGSGQQVVLSR
ncbi:protease inhibitor Inh/omp19 family protein [Martelella limonii]|uniref:protease inhibitor Inh/omp19 family protein n=1 Tax=Martelella limonii TaxID=1647649 RepID=UPI00158098CA|nr:protease inhibitor Inh/omp19 family protein [Martelella limonii]